MIIYKITNNVNKKAYIGQTTRSLSVRKIEHVKNIKTYNHPLYNSMRKYGKHNFSWDILYECESKDELNTMEHHYILHYKSTDRAFGYNLTLGGEGSTGYKHTEDTKANFRATRNIKTYEIIDTEANKYIVTGIKEFCKNHNLDYNSMVKVANRKRSHHKGWTCKHTDIALRYEADLKISPVRQTKNYKIVSPNGKITIVGINKEHTLCSFCKEHALRRSSMSKVANRHLKHHRGWNCIPL